MKPMSRCPVCGKQPCSIVMIEYAYGSPERYDGVSEFRYECCGARMGRWTGKVLADDEIESRYGEKGVVKRELRPS